jgi:transcription-repair coupling factor (superfamily II helicase)
VVGHRGEDIEDAAAHRELAAAGDHVDAVVGEPLIITASVRGALQPLAAGLTDAGVVELAVGARGAELDPGRMP